jgi:hypothetical protein
MRYKAKPFSQLFLFSNDFEKNIDIWFSTSLILEIELKKRLENFDELEAINEVLSAFNKQFKKVTVIINPKESARVLPSLSGQFGQIVYVEGLSGYSKLASYCQCVKRYFDLRKQIYGARSQAICMRRTMKFPVNQQLSLYKPSSDLGRLIREHEAHEWHLKNILNKPFK